MSDPECIAFDIFNRDDIKRAVKRFKRTSDHQYAFTGGERVIDLVRQLCTTDTNDDLVNSVGNMFEY